VVRAGRARLPSFLLESFEEEEWTRDASTALGWIEMTDAGWERARALLAEHFGIVVGR